MATIERVADATEGFSFAYLKELILSATVSWVGDRTQPFAELVLATARLLATATRTESAPRP